MKIANSMYDVVFKYLMEDEEIAIIILSTILKENIISVELLSQETPVVLKSGLRSLRMDFKIKIKLKNGRTRNVLIELQKSRIEENISRFRNYLGTSYQKVEEFIDELNIQKRYTLPITSIYILGANLPKIKIPMLKVQRQYIDLNKNEKLEVEETFVEHLSHDLYVIQVGRLKQKISTELDIILDFLNQNKYQTDNKLIFDYNGDMSNPNLVKIINRLH